MGVRGEINAQIRLQFFGDINPFKDSSAGVQFYSSSSIPPNYTISSILGFVSAVDNEDDPEYVILKYVPYIQVLMYRSIGVIIFVRPGNPMKLVQLSCFDYLVI